MSSHFASQSDLVNALGERTVIDLTDRGSPPSGEIAEDVVNAALQAAGSLIRSYVPDAPTEHDLLTKMAVDLAAYELHSHLAEIPDAVRTRRADSINHLKDISAGRASLGTQPQEPAADGGAATVSGAPGALSRTAQADYLR